MSPEESVVDPVTESDLSTEESVIMSMDNIVLEGDGLDMDAILNNDVDLEENSEQGLAEGELDNSAEGNESKEDLIPEIDRIPETIEKLLTPFEGKPTGEDPRYGDELSSRLMTITQS